MQNFESTVLADRLHHVVMTALRRIRLSQARTIAMLALVWTGACATTTTTPVAVAGAQNVQAEMVVDTVRMVPCLTLYGGSCGYQTASILLTWKGQKERLPYGCLLTSAGKPDAQLSLPPSGGQDRLAYRCSRSETWTLVYLGRDHRSYRACAKYPAVADFAWDRAPGLSAALISLAECPEVYFDDIALEARSMGADTLLDLLVATLGRPAPRRSSKNNLQAWDDAYASLPEPQKRRMTEHFRAAIMSESPILALERSLRYSDLNDPAFLQAMKSHMERILRTPGHYETDASVDMMLRKIALREPAEAAAMACRELEREVQRGALVYLPGALLAIAQEKYPCPPLLKTIQASSCITPFYCSGARNTEGICTHEQLLPEVQRHLNSPSVKPLTVIERERLLLAAARSTPGVEPLLSLWHRRHSYRIEQSATPACKDLYILGNKKGTTCHCFDDYPASACGTLHDETTCVYKVDDAGQRIYDVVSPE